MSEPFHTDSNVARVRERHGATFVIRINRPDRRNAFDLEVREGIAHIRRHRGAQLGVASIAIGHMVNHLSRCPTFCICAI